MLLKCVRHKLQRTCIIHDSTGICSQFTLQSFAGVLVTMLVHRLMTYDTSFLSNLCSFSRHNWHRGVTVLQA